ncbi:MAG: glycerol kinase, partial [Akkermansiaceae bacterium]|nr:glycerol kinase [Akkermansiaceae bacterium]
RPVNIETTAFGAAALAGLATGVWASRAAFSAGWGVDRRFTPREGDTGKIRGLWERAVERTRGWEQGGE